MQRQAVFEACQVVLFGNYIALMFIQCPSRLAYLVVAYNLLVALLGILLRVLRHTDDIGHGDSVESLESLLGFVSKQFAIGDNPPTANSPAKYST